MAPRALTRTRPGRRLHHLPGMLATLTAVLLVLPAAPASAAKLWEHDPRRAHDYRLGERDGETVEVILDPGGFDWPNDSPKGDTAFLELELLARGGEPWVEVSFRNVVYRQYFVPKARGRRYLNLSPIAAAVASDADPGNTRVVLSGNRLQWQTGSASLHVFRNPELRGARVLVVAPHPDDAEIAAFGAYHDGEADVVTVTAGDAGGQNFVELYPEQGSHYRVKGEIRTWDSITVPFFGGVPPGRARNLGYFDATLKKLWLDRPERVPPPLADLDSDDHYRKLNVPEARLFDRSMTSTWPSLVDDLAAEIERVDPEIVIAPHPFLDAHWDHQFTSLALIEAIERGLCEKCELYLYTNHPIKEELSPVGPRDGIAGLSPWYGESLEFGRLYSHPLSPATRNKKLVALEAMHDLRRFDLLDENERPSSAGREARRQRAADQAYSYYRRGGRPNELFYILNKEGAISMKRRFLGDCGADASCGGE